jgi:RHS repeat-associated protein
VGGTPNAEDYSYDATGNQAAAGFSVAATGDNQMGTGAGYSYQYDGDGNRIARWVDNNNTTETSPQSGDTEITVYKWDNRNRLTEVDTYSDYAKYSAQTPDQTIQYSYDYANRWLGETTTTYSGGEGTVVLQREFVYDGNQIVLAFSGSGSVTDRYLYGPAVDQVLADEQVSSPSVAGTSVWTLTDNQNTVRDLAEYNSGMDATAVVNHRVFSAYGQLTSATNPATLTTATVDCLLAYTGRPLDSGPNGTGLQNNLNRWYEAITHQWLSEDPIGADVNLYRYCGNMPLIAVDPSGMKCSPHLKGNTNAMGTVVDISPGHHFGVLVQRLLITEAVEQKMPRKSGDGLKD